MSVVNRLPKSAQDAIIDMNVDLLVSLTEDNEEMLELCERELSRSNKYVISLLEDMSGIEIVKLSNKSKLFKRLFDVLIPSLKTGPHTDIWYKANFGKMLQNAGYNRSGNFGTLLKEKQFDDMLLNIRLARQFDTKNHLMMLTSLVANHGYYDDNIDDHARVHNESIHTIYMIMMKYICTFNLEFTRNGTPIPLIETEDDTKLIVFVENYLKKYLPISVNNMLELIPDKRHNKLVCGDVEVLKKSDIFDTGDGVATSVGSGGTGTGTGALSVLGSFSNLTRTLFVEIIKNLPVEDIDNLCSTNSQFNRVCKEHIPTFKNHPDPELRDVYYRLKFRQLTPLKTLKDYEKEIEKPLYPYQFNAEFKDNFNYNKVIALIKQMKIFNINDAKRIYTSLLRLEREVETGDFPVDHTEIMEDLYGREITRLIRELFSTA